MQDFEVYGIPLRTHTAKSKADAIEFLKNSRPCFSIAVAFMDVVMETDQASLELCQYIREARGAKSPSFSSVPANRALPRNEP